MISRFVSSRSIALMLVLGCEGRLAISNETATSADAASDADGASDANTSTGADAGTPDEALCRDGTRSGNESDIDCGGDCPACVVGASCARHGDCQSGVCRAGLCVEVSCDDGVRNGDETGVDCGGSFCNRCLSSACNCATSAALMPLECDETNGPLDYQTDPLIAADGSSAAFGLCHYNGAAVTTCSTFRWTLAGQKEEFHGKRLLGASADGSKLLLEDDAAHTLALRNIGGGDVEVPLPTGALLSLDGSSVFGITNPPAGVHSLARWTEAGGLELLAELAMPGALEWQLGALTPDASAVVGFVRADAGDVPFRWDAAGGLQQLEGWPDDATGARPLAISRDGSTLGGFITAAQLNKSVFRYRMGEGFSALGPARAVSAKKDRIRLSADGAVLVATSAYPDASSSATILWGNGTRVLTYGSSLGDMTPDGAIVVGDSGEGGFIWKASAVTGELGSPNGDASLLTMLQASGADLSGWDFGSPTNISEDGRILFGRAGCGNVTTYYRWVLPQ
jgi:hypothetical protein